MPDPSDDFFAQRGHDPRGLHPEFYGRLRAAAEDAEAATGERIKFNSLFRTNQQQREAYARYKSGYGGLAAPPGTSRHEFGRAADIEPGKNLDWLRSTDPATGQPRAAQYGLSFLPGRAGRVDPVHIQMAGDPAVTVADRGTNMRLPANALAFNSTEPQMTRDDVMRLYGLTPQGAEPAGTEAPPAAAPMTLDDVKRIYGLVDTPPQPVPTPRNIVTPGRNEQYPGGKVVMEPSDVITPAEQAAGAKRGFVTQAVRSVPVVGPATDLANAAATAALQPGDQPFGQRFTNALAAQDRADNAYAYQNPLLATAAGFLGSGAGFGGMSMMPAGRALLGMSGSTPAVRSIFGGAGGAGINALDAALRREDPLQSGALGGATGFVAPAVGEGVGRAVNAATRNAIARTAPAGVLAGLPRDAADLLIERGIGEMSPIEIRAAIAQAGPNAFVGDITPGMRDITKGLAAVQGPGKDVVTGAYEARNAGGRARLEGILNRHIGSAANLEDFKDSLTTSQKAAADPLYKQFRSTPITMTPELQAMVPRLQAVGAFNEAKFLAGAKGIPINMKRPTAETWDLVKRGLDSSIETALNTGNKTRAGALLELKHELLDEIRKAPGGAIYDQARAVWAEPEELKKQIAAGYDTFQGSRSGWTPDELMAELKNLSPLERDARITGMRGWIRDAMGERTGADATTRNKLLAPNNQAKIKMMIGDKAGNALIKDLEQETFIAGRHPDVIGNPNTGASAVSRGEAANLFKGPPTPEFNLMQPGTYPFVKRFIPTNIYQDVRLANQQRAMPQLADIVTARAADLIPTFQNIMQGRGQAQRANAIAAAADRATTGALGGFAPLAYRRYLSATQAQPESQK